MTRYNVQWEDINHTIYLMQTGDIFGRWKIIRFSRKDERYRKYYLCMCECGKEKEVRGDSLLARGSCGCGNVDLHTKHGYFGTPTYSSWTHMLGRCRNKKHHAYEDYGGRGITICKKWLTFENFLKDMGKKPKGKSLDRIKNEQGYCKKNCRWATPREQSNNKRNNHLITYKGKTQNITQWAEQLGLNRNTIYGRINQRNLSVAEALSK